MLTQTWVVLQGGLQDGMPVLQEDVMMQLLVHPIARACCFARMLLRSSH